MSFGKGVVSVSFLDAALFGRLSFCSRLSFGNIESMKGTTYTLEEAITVMKNSTRLAQRFSIKFRKLSGGDSIIQNASLRPMAATSKDQYGKYKLQLTNEDTGAHKSCYIPLVKEVNGIKVEI